MKNREVVVLLGLTLIALIISGIHPAERGTWWLEVFPVIIGIAILVPTYKRFPLTPLLYRLLFLHALILILGGHYTYAEVPFGNWLKETFHLMRNPYDRIGHFVQGFVPAIVAREILIRKNVVQRKGWLFFIVVCICLAFSACYEFLEWGTAIAVGGAADDFISTQGDIWDTQWDMFLALIGAVTSLLMLSRLHDGQLSSTTSSK